MSKGRKKFNNDKAISPENGRFMNMQIASLGIYHDHPLFKKVLSLFVSRQVDLVLSGTKQSAKDRRAVLYKQMLDDWNKEVNDAILGFDIGFFRDISNILDSLRTVGFYASPELEAIGRAHMLLSLGKPPPTKEEVDKLAREYYPSLTKDERQLRRYRSKLGLNFSISKRKRGKKSH